MKLDGFSHIDYVIISHNHYDHLDRATIKKLHAHYPDICWVVPRGVKKWFHRVLGTKNVLELDWWQSVENRDVRFTAVPAQHFSGRGLFDRNRALWMGCVVEVGKKKFYFAGDTGYNETHFKEIGEKMGPMDLSLLPIGAYAPRKFMQGVHVNPEDSVKIHQEVKSKLSLGGHWWTFRLAVETLDRPPYDLFQALEKEGIDPLEFRVVEPGDNINW